MTSASHRATRLAETVKTTCRYSVASLRCQCGLTSDGRVWSRARRREGRGALLDVLQRHPAELLAAGLDLQRHAVRGPGRDAHGRVGSVDRTLDGVELAREVLADPPDHGAEQRVPDVARVRAAAVDLIGDLDAEHRCLPAARPRSSCRPALWRVPRATHDGWTDGPVGGRKGGKAPAFSSSKVRM